MLALATKKIEGLPFESLKLINVLLSFEGQALVCHYLADENIDLLQYWLDFDETGNRYLLSKVTKDELYAYLSGARSLKDIYENGTTDYLFVLDYNNQNEIENTFIINAYAIPEEYMPEEQSLYPYDLPDYYYGYLNKNFYLESMRKKSVIFRVAPSTLEYQHTVGADDAGEFLTCVSKSMDAYVEYRTHSLFKDIIPNPRQLGRFVRKVREVFSARMPIVGYSSFEVGLAIDPTPLQTEYNVDPGWKNEIIEGYKRDVLDVDYNSEADAAIIREKFDPETRKRIFDPLLRVLQNKDVNISVQSMDKSIERDYSKVSISPEVKEIIVPKPSKEVVERTKRLYQITVLLEEGQDIDTINIRRLRENLLFADENPETTYTISSPIEYEGRVVDLKRDIKAAFTLRVDETFRIEHIDLEIVAEGQNIDEVKADFMRQLFNLIDAYERAKLKRLGLEQPRFIELAKYLYTNDAPTSPSAPTA